MLTTNTRTDVEAAAHSGRPGHESGYVHPAQRRIAAAADLNRAQERARLAHTCTGRHCATHPNTIAPVSGPVGAQR